MFGFIAYLNHTVSVVHQRNSHCYWNTLNMEEGTGLFIIFRCLDQTFITAVSLKPASSRVTTLYKHCFGKTAKIGAFYVVLNPLLGGLLYIAMNS